jgi:lysozyme
MKTSYIGRKLIKSFEGYRSEAYICPAGKLTIGYGHTSGVKEGDTCTEEQADIYLQEDLQWAEKAVNAQNLRLSQFQFDALVSFVYNVGSGNFQESTLLKRIKANPKDYAAIEEEWKRWKYSKGKVLKGLVRRRAAEYELYRNGFFYMTLPIVILVAIILTIKITSK